MFKSKRKGSIIALLVVAAMLCAVPAFALWEGQNKVCETYICENTTGIYAVEVVSTSTGGSGGEGINPKYHRILGFAIVPADTSINSEFFATFYDETSATTESYIFDEAELGATDNKDPRFYPYPKALKRGLTAWMGPNIRVIVFYEDMRKF